MAGSVLHGNVLVGLVGLLQKVLQAGVHCRQLCGWSLLLSKGVRDLWRAIRSQTWDNRTFNMLRLTSCFGECKSIRSLQFNQDRSLSMPKKITLSVHVKREISYLRSMTTNYARCTRELKSRIFLAKAALNKKTSPANWILECSFVWCWDLNTSESRSEMPW